MSSMTSPPSPPQPSWPAWADFAPRDRTYQTACAFLDSIAVKGMVRPTTMAQKAHLPVGDVTYRGFSRLDGMQEWLAMMGHTVAELNALNIVHVAGTNGKGSTCAWIQTFLQAHKARTGLAMRLAKYSSPEIYTYRDMIQINGVDVDEKKYTYYFYEVVDALLAADVKVFARKPKRLQLQMLVMIHLCIGEQIDVLLLEAIMGGEYDCSNVVSAPIATGITKIGLDHQERLGSTVELIAWTKAGIFKDRVPAFTYRQPENVMAILRERARTKNAPLHIVDDDACALPSEVMAMEAEPQRQNCALAISLANCVLSHPATVASRGSLSHEDMVAGLTSFSLIGRYQRIVKGPVHFFLDAGKNEVGLTRSVEWFANAVIQKGEPTLRIIAWETKETRDEKQSLARLVATLKALASKEELVIGNLVLSDCSQLPIDQSALESWLARSSSPVAPNVSKSNGGDSSDAESSSWVENLRFWADFVRSGKIQIWQCGDSKEALERTRSIAKDYGGRVDCLATGSFQLVKTWVHHLNE